MANGNFDHCPNIASHTVQPTEYIGWHEWAEEMGRTHKQRKCSGCGLYAIWIPRRTPAGESDK